MTQHKWHKEIKAWADGAEIEVYYKGVLDNVLTVNDMPNWIKEDLTFRIKPQPKEPQYLYVFCDGKGEQLLRTHTGQNKHDTYIGKIKLED